jgi:hypothetical protein
MRSVAIAPAPDVRLVDGFQEACHGPWQELVCYGGDSQRTLRAVPLRTRGSSDACGAGPFLL